MNIALWSNIRGNGVTSGTAALGIAAAYGFPFQVTLLENHLRRNNLAKALLGSRWSNKLMEGGSSLYIRGDSDSFIREISCKMNRRLVDNASIEVLQDKLFYYCRNFGLPHKLYEYEFYDSFVYLLENHIYNNGIYIIDTEGTNNLSTKEILNKVDQVGVFLGQNSLEIESFFDEYKSILPKAIFILSGYHKKNQINQAYISSIYNIPIERIRLMPFNSNFKCACDEGRVMEFIISNYMCKRGSENYYFIKELKKTAYALFVNADFELFSKKKIS